MMATGKHADISRRLDYAKASLRQQTSLQGLRSMVSELEKREQAAYQRHIADLDNDQLKEAWLAAKIAYEAAKAGLEAKEARETASPKPKLNRK